jgi:hypothetical protein
MIVRDARCDTNARIAPTATPITHTVAIKASNPLGPDGDIGRIDATGSAAATSDTGTLGAAGAASAAGENDTGGTAGTIAR